MTGTMTAEHWRAAFVATLCQITNASPDEAEAEADRILARIEPPIPDDLDVIVHVGTAENAAHATADKWRSEQAELFDDDIVDDLDSEVIVDPLPDEEGDIDNP